MLARFITAAITERGLLNRDGREFFRFLKLDDGRVLLDAPNGVFQTTVRMLDSQRKPVQDRHQFCSCTLFQHVLRSVSQLGNAPLSELLFCTIGLLCLQCFIVSLNHRSHQRFHDGRSMFSSL